MATPAYAQTESDRKSVLLLIGVAKLLKAALLVFFAMELHRLLNPNIGETLRHGFRHFRVDPQDRYIHALIAHITGANPRTLRAMRVGSFIYAALFATEGTGLVLRKRWAEYFTAITTSLLLPVELYEIFHGHHHIIKIIVMLLNLAVVIYLVVQLRRKDARGHS